MQYTESFYTKLFTPGHFCLVGITAQGELITVASARVIEGEQPTDVQQPNEAYIMTLGVKVRSGTAAPLRLEASPRRRVCLRVACGA